MTAPDGLYQLVERFEGNRDAYRSGKYNETQARVEFINPLFELLGWDIDNRSGTLEAYKDVVHEDAIKVGGAHKAPDYGFRVGGSRKFFVEAKKPSVNLREDVDPSFQLRRYAWSAKLPVSILTDFEEFAVYDCRVTPDKNDSAATARLQFHSFDQYPDTWDEIAGVFSKEAVLGGSLDVYAEKAKAKRGTETVDAVFLKEIESWRETLARDLALRNPALTRRELNYAVQVTIDRIIFLRMTEDRGIEDYGRLQALLNGEHVYGRLRHLYRQADERYNSGLFHFQPEKGRGETQDTLTPKLEYGDEALRSIIKSLYYPDSPYEFSVLPIEVLGQVYEQFLGKVIDLSPNRAVKIEEKPEVRKAGGVYYTPKYIVDYIVEQTVGKLVEGKKPGPRGGVRKLRIVDPACGSGSFLIGAYEYLLNWHRDQYIEDGVEKHTKEIYQGRGGEWRLTTGEKKRILLNNIHGVDIDPQAVEVTKLSLLLKVLEGESSESLVTQLSMFRERALPDLSNNIKGGNSLIGPDFYDSGQLTFLDPEEHYRINVFDWKAAFPEIFSGDDPGFDAVIGNPPYLSYSGRQAVGIPESERYYLLDTYQTRGWPTLHSLFIERAVRQLSSRFTSFIVPDQVGHLDGYEAIRGLVTRNAGLTEIRYWGEDVFENVVTPALTFVADSQYSGGTNIVLKDEIEVMAKLDEGRKWSVSPHQELLDKLSTNAGSLERLVADPGVHTGNASKQLVLPANDATADSVPVLEGKQVSRYECQVPNKVLRLDYKPAENEYFTIRVPEKYGDAHFLIRQTAAYPIVGPREHAIYFRNSLLALYSPEDERDVRFLVGLLNSSLMRFAYTHLIQESGQKAFPQVKVRSLRQLPIKAIDVSDAVDKAKHDKLVSLVDHMLGLHEQMDTASTEHERSNVERQVDATDRHIDQLVYELYGLTDEEIAVVEAAGS